MAEAASHDGGDRDRRPAGRAENDVGNTEPTEAGEARAEEPDQRLLRAMADLDNLRKRFVREVARERDTERFRVVSEVLPIIDDLERALAHAGDDADDGLVAGVRAVHAHALDVLARLGFPRFDDIGKPFDPARHEAVGAMEADAPAGTIVDVARPGYGSGDVVLRPAAVVVARSR